MVVLESELPPLFAMLLERMDSQHAGRESLELEFKAARGNLPKNIWETVSAFANTSGGWIILGVNDDVSPPEVEGVANAHALLQTFFNLMRNDQKISSEVCGALDTEIERLDGKDVILIRIPAAPRKQRPIYIDGNPYRGTFIRRHSGDYHCNKAEVDRMMREASDESADATILANYGWDDLNRESLKRYRQRFQTAKPGHIWNGFSDEEFLGKLGGFRRDRDRQVEGPTVAGLLMFGNPESIREWRSRHLFDFQVSPDDLWSSAEWDDRFTWEGNLLGAFESIYPRLIAGIAAPFKLENGIRVDDTPVHVAVREALVNLLIHADYSETESSLIVRSPRGYLFRNPGNSRVPYGDLYSGRHSDPRNPTLVFMFRQINLAEEAGSGIQRIVAAWQNLGFTDPSIDIGTDRYSFTLQLLHIHLFTDEDRIWLASLEDHFDESEQLALLIARHEGEVDNARLRRLTGQHSSDVTKVLRSLRERNLLEMVGWGRGASYELGRRVSREQTQLLIPGLLEQPSESGILSLDTALSSGEYGHSPRSALNSDTSRPSSDTSSRGFDRSLLDSHTSHQSDVSSVRPDLPNPTQERLEAIAARIHDKSWIRANELETVIVELCSVQPLSIRELAILLQRSAQRIRALIRNLENDNQIETVFPRRHHPNQRYTTRERDARL